MVTRPVTIKAMLRVCFDLAAKDAEPATDRVTRWAKRLAPWSQLVRELHASSPPSARRSPRRHATPSRSREE